MADVIGIDEIMNDDECLENISGPYFVQCQSVVEVTVVLNLDRFQYSSVSTISDASQSGQWSKSHKSQAKK